MSDFIMADFHIHSEYSYDSNLPLGEILAETQKDGLVSVGITDHLNYNDASFWGNLRDSAEHVKPISEKNPKVILGVELTPIPQPLYDYIVKNGSRDGYTPPSDISPYPFTMAATKEEIRALGVRYAIGASHWLMDSPTSYTDDTKLEHHIKDWYRQQMWLACDERVTILGHPWYIGSKLWYEDFSVIPRSMNLDIIAALRENKKYIECNPCMLSENAKVSERFAHQYAEFLREAFEAGVPITYGSDSHNTYKHTRDIVEKFLRPAGFKEGDFTEALAPELLW